MKQMIKKFNFQFYFQNSDDGLKIIDFGHSLQLPVDTATVKLSRMQGTLEYLSPEVLRCDQVRRPGRYILSTIHIEHRNPFTNSVYLNSN